MSLPNWQSLRVLSAYMCPNLSSLHPISNSKIIKLDLGRSTDLADLTPIKNLPLEWIAFRYDEGLRVEDAKVLRTMKTLKTINHKLTTDFWTSYDLAN